MLNCNVAPAFELFVKSPKSVASPVDAMVINSILLYAVVGEDRYPPAIIPLVLDAHASRLVLASCKLPKSTAFPVDAIFTSIISKVDDGSGSLCPLIRFHEHQHFLAAALARFGVAV